MENRRQFPRFESTFQVKYHLQGKDAHPSFTISKDISRGGVCMPTSSGMVNKGDIVKLEIQDNYGDKSVLATGKIKWLKTINREAPLDEEAGIEFLDASPDYVDSLIKDRKRPPAL